MASIGTASNDCDGDGDGDGDGGDDGNGDGDGDGDDDNSYLRSETEAATDEIKFRGQDCDNGPAAAAAAAAAMMEGGQPQITEAISMCANTSRLKK